MQFCLNGIGCSYVTNLKKCLRLGILKCGLWFKRLSHSKLILVYAQMSRELWFNRILSSFLDAINTLISEFAEVKTEDFSQLSEKLSSFHAKWTKIYNLIHPFIRQQSLQRKHKGTPTAVNKYWLVICQKSSIENFSGNPGLDDSELRN